MNPKKILTHFENAKEQLLSLGDDLWLSIDHTDNQALQEGAAFKQEFNKKISDLDRLTEELSVLLQQFSGMEKITPMESEKRRALQNDRILKELDRCQPHTLDENFSYKKPYGFQLAGQGFSEIESWRAIYTSLLEHLRQNNPEQFSRLLTAEFASSKRGTRFYSEDPAQLRTAARIDEQLYAEVNLSANSIRDTIRKLLEFFGFTADQFKLYLQADRNGE